MDEVKLEQGFDLLDKDGNFLGLACLYLKEDVELFTGKLKGYSLHLKLLGQDNYFTADEINSINIKKPSKVYYVDGDGNNCPITNKESLK